MTRVLVAHFYELKLFPPVLNLIDVFVRNHIPTKVVTFDEAGISERYRGQVDFHILKKTSENPVLDFALRKRAFRQIVTALMRDCDVLWTTTDRTVRELGSLTYQYKHIMQLMELIEDYPLLPRQNIIKAHLYRYARKAYRVVVPEYNRAHILKTWWNLPELPVILPNKPASFVTENVNLKEMEELERAKAEGQKILLYQGILNAERPLETFAKAAETLNGHFRFCVMGDDRDGTIRQLCARYPNTFHIPFIAPPHHLRVTKAADIGILSYTPDRTNKSSSPLNALYCAPNKIYEYAGAGLPMLGNDVPGLRYPMEHYGMGEICDLASPDDICNKIRMIESAPERYRAGCKAFYDATDLDDIIINKILGDKGGES